MTRSAVLQDLEAQTSISPEDVLRARAVLFTDMLITPEEAESLFRINDGAKTGCPEWRELFIEAITDYLVRQETPPGYVDQAKADWLVARIASDGRIKTGTELDLLVHILEIAEQAPESLSRFALRQAAEAALTPERRAGDGPTLTGDEVSRLRRILYAFAGEGGGAAVSREEAELLFAINDAAKGRPNDPSWRQLFVHAVGSSIMQAAGYRPPSRQETLRRQAWLEAPTEGVAGTLLDSVRSMFSGGLAAGLKALREDDKVYEGNNAADESAARQAAPVNAEEARWLMSRISRDGGMDDNERALLLFLKDEADGIAPEIAAMLSQAETPHTGKAFGKRRA